MDIRHFRHFLMVAEELHFGRAAQRLNMAQAPLSQSIKRFETWLGTDLFDRSSRGGTRLTRAGQVLKADAEKVILQFEQAVTNARLAGDGAKHPVTVGFVTGGILDLIPKALNALHNSQPDIKVKLIESGTQELLRMLHEDEIDVAVILPSEYCPTGVKISEVKSDKTLLALHRDHPLAKQANIQLTDLKDEPLIFFPNSVNPVLHKRLKDYFRNHGFTPNIDQEARQTPTMLSLVSAELGICFVQESAKLLPFPDVVFREVEALSHELTWSLSVAWKPSRALRSTLTFVDCLQQAARGTAHLVKQEASSYTGLERGPTVSQQEGRGDHRQ